MDLPIIVIEQLRPQLTALRKRAGLTQAALGARLGVSQSRIAEIEANPGLVSTEKMLQLLRELDVDMVLRERAPARADRGPGSRTPGLHEKRTRGSW